jgi:lysophospholipase L1-like esterase
MPALVPPRPPALVDPLVDRPSAFWTPANLPGLVTWVDLLSAARYTLSGSDITSIVGRAGTHASTPFEADAGTAPPAADASTLPTIGDSGADLLAGYSCLKLGTNTTAAAVGIAARGTGSWTVIALIEPIAYTAGGVYGAIASFGQRYIASPLTEKNSGGLGLAEGLAWGGGVSAGSVVHTTPTDGLVSKVTPSARAVRRVSGGATTLWYDGAQNATATIAHDIPHTGLLLGRAGGYASPECRVYAALWVAGALSDADIARASSWLLRAYHVGYTHVVGDSIPAGVGTTTPATDAWPVIYQADLRATHGYGTRVNNTAVSGRTSASVLAELSTDVLSVKSGLYGGRERCLIACVSNDFAVSAPEVEGALADAKTNVAAIVAALLAAGIEPWVVEVLDRDDWNATARSAALDEEFSVGVPGYNQWLRDGGAGTSNVITVQSTLQPGGFGTGTITYSDLVHPDTAGSEVIGEFIAAALAPRFA